MEITFKFLLLRAAIIQSKKQYLRKKTLARSFFVCVMHIAQLLIFYVQKFEL